MDINGLEFIEFIGEEQVQQKVRRLAAELSIDYAGKIPVLLPVLNGSFMFAADLIKAISIHCKVSFTKVSSYEGTNSSGRVKTLIGLDDNLSGQDVIIIEDIVDTGLTLAQIVEALNNLGARSVEVVSLLRKKPARDRNIRVKYVGFEIADEFVLGYGLDYKGLGRNYPQIFQGVGGRG